MTKAIVRAAVWLLGFVGVLTLLLAVNAWTGDTLPDALEYVSTGVSGVSFDRLRVAREKVGEIVTVSGRADLICSASGTEIPADYGTIRLARTDEYYPALHKLRLVRGGWFGSPEDCGYENVCVIPDTLALRAFRSTDILGAPITLGGVICRVVGVYEADGGLLAQYASDGYELAFVPDYVRPEGAEDTVTLLYLKEKPSAAQNGGESNPSDETNSQTADTPSGQTDAEAGSDSQTVSYTARTALETALGGGLYFYEQNDYLDRQALARQSVPTLIFLCGLCVAVCLVGYIYRGIERAAAFARQKASEHLSATRREWVRVLLPPGLLFAGLVVLLLLTAFTPYFPNGFLPGNGHIFDLSHYADIVIQASQHRNLSQVYLYYDDCATAVLWLNAVLIAVGTALFAGLAAAACRLLRALFGRE